MKEKKELKLFLRIAFPDVQGVVSPSFLKRW
jgi:hypothetical protein